MIAEAPAATDIHFFLASEV